MSFSEGEFITSAAASELYEKYYAKDFSPSEFLNIALEDPTTKSPRDTGTGGDETYTARHEDSEALQYLKKVTLGSYTRQLLTWCKMPYAKSFVLNGGILQVPYVLVKLWDSTTESVEEVFGCISDEEITEEEAKADNTIEMHNSAFVPFCFSLYGLYMQFLQPEFKSVNKYKSIEDFYGMLATQVYSVTMVRYTSEMRKEVKVYCDNEDWFIFTPLTFRASKFFAGDSSWCTADRDGDSNHFNNYSSRGTLYCIMNKKDITDSAQIFVPSREGRGGYDFEAKDFEDHDLRGDYLDRYFEVVRDNTDFDIEEMYRAPDPVYEYRVYFSFDNDSQYDEFSVEASLQLDENIEYPSYNYEGDSDYESGWGGLYTFQLGLFDLNDADFSMITDSPEVNFSNPGLVLKVDDSDAVDIDNEFSRNCENYSGDFETDTAFYERLPGGENDLLDDLSPTKNYGDKSSGLSYHFVVVLGDAGLLDPTDLVNDMFGISPRTNRHPKSRIRFGYNSLGASVLELSDVTYAGKEYASCYILYCTEDGDMETAMRNQWFADMMARGRPSSSPRQRETDKQLDLDLFKESIQRSKQHLSQIYSRRTE